jgi:DNA-binding NtrC family response regulator
MATIETLEAELNSLKVVVKTAITKMETETTLKMAALPEEIRQPLSSPVATKGKVRPLDEIEKDYILAALELNDGNQTHTAEQLHIGSATLYRKLKSYGLIGKKNAVAC